MPEEKPNFEFLFKELSGIVPIRLAIILFCLDFSFSFFLSFLSFYKTSYSKGHKMNTHTFVTMYIAKALSGHS